MSRNWFSRQTVGVHTHFHTHALPPPLSLPFHHFSIFISVIYSKSNSCQSHTNTHARKKRFKKRCKFTALGNSCCNIYSKDHSKILKMCHHRRSAPASVTICFLLKHYTQKKHMQLARSAMLFPAFFFFPFRSARSGETVLAQTNNLLSPAELTQLTGNIKITSSWGSGAFVQPLSSSCW